MINKPDWAEAEQNLNKCTREKRARHCDENAKTCPIDEYNIPMMAKVPTEELKERLKY